MGGKQRLYNRKPIKPEDSPQYDWEDDDFIAKCADLAYEGFFNVEIADELNISRSLFKKAVMCNKKLHNSLKTARARADEDCAERPSPAKFRRAWLTCDGKRTKLMKIFNIGYSTLLKWLEDEPKFKDILAENDLAFLEQADIVGRILSLGGIKEKDTFPGWERYPDGYMLRFYMNTLGKRYGYGEPPVLAGTEELPDLGNVEQGINIEKWITQEMTLKQETTENDN